MLAKVTRLSELDPSILEGFACGDEWMDDWLTRKAPLQLSRNLCVMHVGLDEDGRAVGFFTLSNCQVEPRVCLGKSVTALAEPRLVPI